MKKIIIALLIFSISFSVQGCSLIYKIRNIFRFGEKTEFNYGVTALQWLPYIIKRAHQWRGDAYLYGISETKVNKDGVSDEWNFLFYSPGSEKTAMVVYEAGFISLKDTVMPPLNPVRKFDIDSPTALNIALQNGGEEFVSSNENLSIIISLSGPKFESRYRQSKWTIRYYGDTQTLTMTIDAQTGKLISKK